MFAIELGWSADIPPTLNTGSPSFGTRPGLPVSQTSWHCCGSQHSPARRPHSQARGPGGAASELAQRGPLPRAVPRARRPGRLTAAGRWLRPRRPPVPLRKLVCPSGRGARVLWVPPPPPPRRGLHVKQPPLLAAAGPPAPARSCHGPGMLTSRRNKGSARAARGRALLPAPSRRSLGARCQCRAGGPLPAPSAPPRPAAPWKPEREAEPGEGGGGGARAGAAQRATGAERAGRPRGLEAEARKEGLRRGGGRAPGRQPLGSAGPAPRPGESPAPRGREEGAAPRAATEPRKSPDKGRPRPPPPGPAPVAPPRPPPRAPSPARSRRAQKGHPPPRPPALAGPLGPICQQGRRLPRAARPRLAPALPPKALRASPVSPLVRPGQAQQHAASNPALPGVRRHAVKLGDQVSGEL